MNGDTKDIVNFHKLLKKKLIGLYVSYHFWLDFILKLLKFWFRVHRKNFDFAYLIDEFIKYDHKK